ncbi:MAG: alpha/beta hydrolase [Brucella sp.]
MLIRHVLRGIAFILILFATQTVATAAERDVVLTPVPVVQPRRMGMALPSGKVEVPIAMSKDWTTPQVGVTRAIIVIHGWPRRDLGAGEHAAKVAGPAALATIVITPQFVTAKDVAAHQLPSNTLRWGENAWQKGEPSDDETATSSFQVVDEIFRHLADRSIFPNLHMIVLAGHSAGGQFVQRYAAVGRGEAKFAAPIQVRYVVANPASYLYFTSDRPNAHGSGFVKTNSGSCPLSNTWPYSVQSGVPGYALPLLPVADLAKRYLHRDVVYLLGAADNDPKSDGSDLTCAGEAEGATRLTRGLAYNAYVHMLDPSTKQRVVEVLGVGHKSYAMYASTCGLSVLFDEPGCEPVSSVSSK